MTSNKSKKPAWKPRIVGGTDYGDGLEEPSPVHKEVDVSTMDEAFQFLETESSEDDPIVISHEKLARYASTIPEEAEVSWNYGPIIAYRDGNHMAEGQYVIEYRRGEAFQVFWIPQ